LASKPLVYALLRVWCSIRLDLITIPKSDRSENPFLCLFSKKSLGLPRPLSYSWLVNFLLFNRTIKWLSRPVHQDLKKKWLKVKTSKLDSNVVFLVRFHDEGLLSGTAYVPSICSTPSSERFKDRFPIRTVQRAPRRKQNRCLGWTPRKWVLLFHNLILGRCLCTLFTSVVRPSCLFSPSCFAPDLNASVSLLASVYHCL